MPKTPFYIGRCTHLIDNPLQVKNKNVYKLWNPKKNINNRAEQFYGHTAFPNKALFKRSYGKGAQISARQYLSKPHTSPQKKPQAWNRGVPGCLRSVETFSWSILCLPAHSREISHVEEVCKINLRNFKFIFQKNLVTVVNFYGICRKSLNEFTWIYFILGHVVNCFS